ncbi:hypothetical protein NGB36_02430 [Streptomyces sp. RB6PN25]|uniref:Integral membrane protein n=1 Tax=Streptomyces humicola TaxID=2953240 RepID=A0ABT1PP83_9ACTN|nr:hypothetical protein [Streptomyces humicola]MCQ4079486.1 hypothetical protein [Streptomyces humicola]
MATALLLSLASGCVVVLLGGGVRAVLAPAAVPALVAAALVNACRGAAKQHLMLSPAQTPVGGAGPAVFLLWYAAGPLTALAALAVPFMVALQAGTAAAVGGAAAVSVAAASGLLRWAYVRAGKLTP